MSEGKVRILLYQLSKDSEEGKTFRRIAGEHGCEIMELEPGDLSSDIKTLYNRPLTEAADCVSAREDKKGFCVLCGLSKATFDLLLNEWREAGVGRQVLKAVATEHNQTWPLGELFAELEREHALTLAYIALRKRVLGFEAALDKKGIRLPRPEDNEDPAMHERLRTLADAKDMLDNFKAINSAQEIIEVDQAFCLAWNLPR